MVTWTTEYLHKQAFVLNNSELFPMKVKRMKLQLTNGTGAVVAEYDLSKFDAIEITGVDRAGRRFPCKRFKADAQGVLMMNSYNIYRGTKWLVDKQGKRIKIGSWWN